MNSRDNHKSIIVNAGHGHESHGHGHHAPDDKTLTASYMLIGGVTLVMAMFYLVQHPEPWFFRFLMVFGIFHRGIQKIHKWLVISSGSHSIHGF